MSGSAVLTTARIFALLIVAAATLAHPNTATASTNFAQEVLDAHNYFRAHHGAAPLELDSELNQQAQEWADHLAGAGLFGHRPNNRYGENLYAAVGATTASGQSVTEARYDEVRHYNFDTPGFSMSTGHFTQLVWKDTTKIGVGLATRANTTYVVANYDPPGNALGHFPANVLRPQ
ncbi:CAP family protein [Nocardia fluminea]|uniref:CAP family protein n=1 Tax=Nocardia fluminea TaxID=134984 RepID=UPI0033EB518C